jgi:hypothetical protein
MEADRNWLRADAARMGPHCGSCLAPPQRKASRPVKTNISKERDPGRRPCDLLPNLPSFIRRICSSFTPWHSR